MAGGFIEKRIRNTNARLIIIGVVGLAIILIILLLSAAYYRNFIFGPYKVTGSELKSEVDSGHLYHQYISIDVNDIFDSEIYDTSTDESGNSVVSQHYYVLTNGGYQIVFGAESYNGEKTVTGELYWLSSSGAQQFFDSIKKTEPGTGKTFLGLLLLPGNFRTRGYYGIFLSLLAMLFSGILIGTGARRSLHPELHPGMKDLSRFGPAEFTSSRIDTEMEMPHQTIGSVHFLSNWLFAETSWGFQATRYDDIVWTYKQRVPSRNFGLTFAIVEALMVYDRQQKVLYLPCNRGQLDKMMSTLLPHIPYSYRGYSNDMANAWRQNPQTLIRGFEDKKTALTAAQVPATPSGNETPTGSDGQSLE